MQGEYGHLCFPCVVERQTWHLVVLCLHRGHTVQCCTLQKCIVHISLCYTVAAVHWCNDDHLFSFARFMDFSWYWAPPQQLYYMIHCTVSSPHVTSKAGSSLFLSILCLFGLFAAHRFLVTSTAGRIASEVALDPYTSIHIFENYTGFGNGPWVPPGNQWHRNKVTSLTGY